MEKRFDLKGVVSRIVDHVELYPRDILDHPGQAWDHPTEQAEALVGALRQVGIIDELLVYRSERAGGAFVTPDGHLRKSLDPDLPWPCAVLNINDREADFILMTKDPLGSLKMWDIAAFQALRESVEIEDEALRAVMDQLLEAQLQGDLEAAGVDGDTGETGHLLELAEVTIAEPEHGCAAGEVWALGGHILICADVFNGWRTYVPYLTRLEDAEGEDGRPVLLVPYPGPFVPLTLRGEKFRLVMVQPDPFVCGHIMDRWAEQRGEDSIKRG